jgi:hypothetical protein
MHRQSKHDSAQTNRPLRRHEKVAKQGLGLKLLAPNSISVEKTSLSRAGVLSLAWDIKA